MLASSLMRPVTLNKFGGLRGLNATPTSHDLSLELVSRGSIAMAHEGGLYIIDILHE